MGVKHNKRMGLQTINEYVTLPVVPWNASCLQLACCRDSPSARIVAHTFTHSVLTGKCRTVTNLCNQPYPVTSTTDSSAVTVRVLWYRRGQQAIVCSNNFSAIYSQALIRIPNTMLLYYITHTTCTQQQRQNVRPRRSIYPTCLVLHLKQRTAATSPTKAHLSNPIFLRGDRLPRPNNNVCNILKIRTLSKWSRGRSEGDPRAIRERYLAFAFAFFPGTRGGVEINGGVLAVQFQR